MHFYLEVVNNKPRAKRRFTLKCCRTRMFGRACVWCSVASALPRRVSVKVDKFYLVWQKKLKCTSRRRKEETLVGDVKKIKRKNLMCSWKHSTSKKITTQTTLIPLSVWPQLIFFKLSEPLQLLSKIFYMSFQLDLHLNRSSVGCFRSFIHLKDQLFVSLYSRRFASIHLEIAQNWNCE